MKKRLVIDPSSLYEMRIDDNLRQMRTSKELIPRLVSEYIPKSIFRNVNLYIDPWAKWNVGSFLVAPASRVRERKFASVLGTRGHWNTLDRRGSTATYPQVGAPTFTDSSSFSKNYYNLTPMASGYSWSKDTTGRLRGYNRPYGEFERFKVLDFNSPARSHLSLSWIESYANGFGGQNYSKGRDYRRWGVDGSSAHFPQSSFDFLRNQAIQACKDELVKSGPRAMMGCLPAFRPYTFGRSIIELRDLPRTLFTLQQSIGRISDIYRSMGSIRDTVFSLTQGSKQVPKEYLGYHFAWKQMYEDVVKLIASPEKIAKRFNYLQRKAGKVSTVRYSMKYQLPSVRDPGLWYDQIVEYERDRVEAHVNEREIEFKAMCSLYFDFPPVALPVLRENRVRDMLGFSLRPTDLYKVTPWTWLYDWFTNLGSYIDLIDTVNRDKVTINYGFVTAILRGKVTSTYRFNYTAEIGDLIYSDAPNYHFQRDGSVNLVSTLRYEAAVRLYASNLGATPLRVISTKSNLTTWQQSILAALLAARIKR